MYNRYIPQSDGSYRRSRVPDHPVEQPHPAPPRQAPPPPPPEPEPEPVHTPPPQDPPRQQSRPPRQESRQDSQGSNVMGFLKQLLPQNFDTGDLMVVLLLLLMSENCKDNTALLTLVIYLFL